MIKTRAILAALTALTILFSPSIFAESYKTCKYWHEEYRLVNGIKTYDYDQNGIINNEGIPSHIYATYTVGVNESCPEVPPAMPGHVWVPNDTAENGNSDYDISYLGIKTEENEHCLAHMTSITIRNNWDIQ